MGFRGVSRYDRIMNFLIGTTALIDIILVLLIIGSMPRVVVDFNAGKPSALEQRILDREDQRARQRESWRNKK